MDAPRAEPGRRTRATARIVVNEHRRTPFDETGQPRLAEIALSETFSGGIEATSAVRALQVLLADGSASMVSVQRVCGQLDGRRGTFVLEGRELVERGKVKGRWAVVPRSGTDELRGLRGEGGFEGDFGTGSDGHLDYWFE